MRQSRKFWHNSLQNVPDELHSACAELDGPRDLSGLSFILSSIASNNRMALFFAQWDERQRGMNKTRWFLIYLSSPMLH